MRYGHARRLPSPTVPRLEVTIASTGWEVLEAQRLRYRVFAEELGAALVTPAAGIDGDEYDAWCEHLLLRDTGTGEVVGTYRILPWEQARRRGGFYSESEFDLGVVRTLPGLVEIGRACVDARYRGGVGIALLWGGLLRWLHDHTSEYVIGCASVGTNDGGETAAAVCRQLLRDHLCPPEWRVRPRRAFPLDVYQEGDPAVSLPALVKGYLRLGAFVCGPPAWDARFRTADLLLMLPMRQLDPRYARRLLRAA